MPVITSENPCQTLAKLVIRALATSIGVAVTSVAPLGVTAAPTSKPPFSHLRIVVPSGPGGGLDTTARAMQVVLPEAGIAGTASVENIAGGAGLIGLTQFVSAERGTPDVLMMGGSGMFGAALAHRSPITFADTTPIALLASEYYVLLVRSDSAFETLDALIRALRDHPESISWAGGQATGVEQLAAWQIAATVGIDPGRVTYIPFAGGGEMMPALLGGQITVGMNYAWAAKPYIDAGAVRALGVSSPERIPSMEVPTLREQGVDVQFDNWRALVAPPGITVADRQRLETAAQTLVHSAQWLDALSKYGWANRFLTGPALTEFLAAEEARIRNLVGRVRRNAVDAPSVGLYPVLVLSALVGVALVLASRTRARQTHIQPSGAGLRALLPVVFASLLSIATLEPLGFVLTASALFWITARAFDATHPARDAAWAVGLALGAYLLFARVLEQPLPPGVFANLR